MRAAIYCRVSSEEQVEGYSISAQQRACKDYCTSHDWEVVAEYIDEGKSARVDDLAKRPAFQQMMQDALSHRFDLLIVHKIDRFSRNRRVAFECFDRLGKAGIGFVSISENMDFSAPWGQFALTMLVGLAQLFSDNLSLETKKGKRERKAQGFYNGLLPFGTIKGGDGLPTPDTRPLSNGSTNYEGLVLAFQAAAEGKSDREIATLLNARGYRTTGNRGANLFRKDTVRRILMNRFYIGELPDGNGNWLPGKHQPILDSDLFERAQKAREQNRTFKAPRCTTTKGRIYALTGLLRCGYCGGNVNISAQHDTPRAYCYSRTQGLNCDQRSVPASLYEEQVSQWLGELVLPDDAVEKALAQYAEDSKKVGKPENERKRLELRLERLKELYSWGDIDRSVYQRERDQIQQQLRTLAPERQRRHSVKKLVDFIKRISTVWSVATPVERNQLLGRIVEKIVVKDGQVIDIVPRPDLSFMMRACQLSSWTCGSDGIRTRGLSLDRAAC